MNNRQRVDAILHGREVDRMPVVAFGYWVETLDKWAQEGHISLEDAQGYRREGDGGAADRRIMDALGFDFNWNSCPARTPGCIPRSRPRCWRNAPTAPESFAIPRA